MDELTIEALEKELAELQKITNEAYSKAARLYSTFESNLPQPNKIGNYMFNVARSILQATKIENRIHELLEEYK